MLIAHGPSISRRPVGFSSRESLIPCICMDATRFAKGPCPHESSRRPHGHYPKLLSDLLRQVPEWGVATFMPRGPTESGDHYYAMDASEVIWEFFQRHSKR